MSLRLRQGLGDQDVERAWHVLAGHGKGREAFAVGIADGGRWASSRDLATAQDTEAAVVGPTVVCQRPVGIVNGSDAGRACLRAGLAPSSSGTGLFI